MYQLEVKRWLVEHQFPPSDGWTVTVDIDAMERANGGQHAPDKTERTRIAEDKLRKMGVTIGPHPQFGRADIVAEHQKNGLFIIEVEGKSSRQPEQAVYSALGQLLLQMQERKYKFVLALPDEESWQRQVNKIPIYVKTTLCLSCALVSETRVRLI
jgi:hypothetical protein